MLYSNATKIILFITTFSIIGCASNSYHRIEAEPVKLKANYKGIKPAGLVEDAMRIETMPLFDGSTYERIESAAQSSDDIASAQLKIRDAVCDEAKARQPKLTIHLILNKPMKGQALDVVEEKNRLIVNQVELYLKQYWLDEGSRTDLMSLSYNSDFEMYQKNMVETDMERKSADQRISVGIPFITGDSFNDAIKYFKQAHATPNLRPFEQTGPTQWFPSKSFLSLAFKDHEFVLSNKVSDFVVTTWGHEVYGTEMKTEIGHDVQLEPSTTFENFGGSDGTNFRKSSHYKPSASSWKLADGTIANPLVIYYFDDLAILKSEFVFKVPKEELEHLFGITSANELQYFGYDLNSGDFSASLALEHQAYAWSQMLGVSTQISQTDKKDNWITFEVKPRFIEPFCKWTVPVSTLKASD